MDKVGVFLKGRWGSVVIWVVVMYVTAFVWNVLDSRGWYAFPTYILVGLVWVGSFANMLSCFFEWTGSSVRFKPFETPVAEKENETEVVNEA